MPDDPHDVLAKYWRRHERRRESGVPTVSVLTGEVEPLASTLEAVLANTGMGVVWASAGETDMLASEFLSALEATHRAAEEALERIALALGQPALALRTGWAAKSSSERRLWLEHCPAKEHPQLSAALAVLRDTLAPEDEPRPTPLARLRALQAFMRRDALACCIDEPKLDRLDAVLRLAADAPELPLVALVEGESWRVLLPRLHARSRAVPEEGLVPELSFAASIEAETELPRGGEPGSRPQSPSLRVQASDALANVRVASLRHVPDAAVLIARARSLAEQRLFELLQADPLTRDLFILNGALPFTFGPRKAEIDLLCVELRLALEVDGYHHFNESDAYRRDRRKDVLLQHHGYLVSRHLATDVVDRAGEVMRHIRELVLRRRRTFRRENAT